MTLFEGFGLGRVRGLRLTSYTIAAPRRTEIVACSIEIETLSGVEEHQIAFLEPYPLAGVQALLELLNRKVREVSV
jgi:hypothetical protein